MESHNIPAGTEILIGAPSRRMPQAQSAAIADMLARIPGVVEAHLPQCFIPGVMQEPSMILALVLAPGVDAEKVMGEVGCHLGAMLPEDERLDVWPLTGTNPILKDVRAVDCRILGAEQPAKAWWKIWR